MKVGIDDYEIKVSYWPATPHLREIKIYIFGDIQLSMFLNKEQLTHFSKVLAKVAENIEPMG